jgi:bacterioferritin
MADKEQMIDKLNDLLRHEWTGVAQYNQFGFVVVGIWREVYSKLFLANADESLLHARQVAEKIVAMGGVPTVERKPVQQTTDVRQMLNHGLDFEQAAVDLYTEALEMAEYDRALVVFLEDILLQEQQGVDELTMLLRDHDSMLDTIQAAAKMG